MVGQTGKIRQLQRQNQATRGLLVIGIRGSNHQRQPQSLASLTMVVSSGIHGENRPRLPRSLVSQTLLVSGMDGNSHPLRARALDKTRGTGTTGTTRIQVPAPVVFTLRQAQPSLQALVKALLQLRLVQQLLHLPALLSVLAPPLR